MKKNIFRKTIGIHIIHSSLGTWNMGIWVEVNVVLSSKKYILMQDLLNYRLNNCCKIMKENEIVPFKINVKKLDE